TNPKDEKGDQIIDFNFNPTDRGLISSFLDRKPVYLLDSKTNDLEKANYDLAAKYFMSLIENEHDRFHMDSLDVSGENFTFANYFSHLMQTFLPEHIGPNDGRGVSETDENILPVIENAIEDNALGSMKILELLEK
ncbi:MAG: hypothetical protein HY072_01740, partial [Deltaproteobacteria bacterium]|nr:hypothetical protein [Deltaproteobacteria bacterium]